MELAESSQSNHPRMQSRCSPMTCCLPIYTGRQGLQVRHKGLRSIVVGCQGRALEAPEPRSPHPLWPRNGRASEGSPCGVAESRTSLREPPGKNRWPEGKRFLSYGSPQGSDQQLRCPLVMQLRGRSLACRSMGVGYLIEEAVRHKTRFAKRSSI
jgi:hypothetical protein